MALFVCKCLNVSLESDKLEDILDIGKLELSLAEQRDIFFSEKLLACPANSLKTHVVQPALIGHRIVGRFSLETCLACRQTTRALLQERNLVLLAKPLQTTQEHINNLKKSENFSPVFHLLVPEVTNEVEMKENIDTNNQYYSERNGCSPSLQVIGALKKQLNQTLESQLEAIEETVRQFKDQKYAEYEEYRVRAQRDHKILSSIINKTRTNFDNDGWNNSLDKLPSPTLQRRRLSSIKDAKKFTKYVKSNAQIPHEEDSLDAEDIFDLEGMDSCNYMASDNEDYDSDQLSNDESMAPRARPGAAAASLARSLPVRVPVVMSRREDITHEEDYEETQDIAASIKALARSVHGDVFELPRPRFSTQI
ncbi:uncharacterized protein LOC116766421 [Danaus plexippus]|uniref:uncharacterized protein LOC116766421 n=1 Tax=Danaus plexippus TaxID=13037 RepID=UPI002AAF385B|nr:uncharacterized protein LOC116766421 [Danaus plexippus]